MENFLVLSTMELPFVGGNRVVKMSKIRVRFLWYHICFKREYGRGCCFRHLFRFLLFSLFFFVGNAYSPFWNFLHVFLEYFTFCHSEKKLGFYTVN